jgi:hypothetical protein
MAMRKVSDITLGSVLVAAADVPVRLPDGDPAADDRDVIGPVVDVETWVVAGDAIGVVGPAQAWHASANARTAARIPLIRTRDRCTVPLSWGCADGPPAARIGRGAGVN